MPALIPRRSCDSARIRNGRNVARPTRNPPSRAACSARPAMSSATRYSGGRTGWTSWSADWQKDEERGGVMSGSSGRQLPTALSMQGRRALVTGAASGIGRATAGVLAQLGAELLLNDRASLAETRAEVEGLGASCTEMQGDLT